VTPVYCREDEQLLGWVGPSAVGMRGHRLVWHVPRGWRWHPLDRILTRDDYTYRMEAMLAHELKVTDRTEGARLSREVDLDGAGLRVRCPKCRKVRIFNADNALRAARR
jgi:hypothetical protein